VDQGPRGAKLPPRGRDAGEKQAVASYSEP
jgi:hypothetical protein